MSKESQVTHPVLSLKNVCVGYAGVYVAQNVDFNIHKGDCFGLVGVNGAGKTSLIKALIGLREQDEGEISIFGQTRLNDEVKRDFGYLPERFEPPWFLKGEEFIKFTMSLYERTYDQEKLLAYCNDILLDPECLTRRITTYSKGMRQKLGLIATLMSGVDLLILDEPMSGLDPLARVSVKNLLKRANAEGRTIFLSSHILADIDDLCSHMAVLDDTKIQFYGSPQELKSRYGLDSLENAFLHLVRPEMMQAA